MLAFVGITIVGVHAVLAGAWHLAEILGAAVRFIGAFMVGFFLLGFTLHGLVVIAGRKTASPRGCSEEGAPLVRASGRWRTRDS